MNTLVRCVVKVRNTEFGTRFLKSNRLCIMQRACTLHSAFPGRFNLSSKFAPLVVTRSFATPKPENRMLQELPDQRFWMEVFHELIDNYPGNAPEGAKVDKWLKNPREPVKRGENIVDLEVSGAVISLRSDFAGFLGSHLVKEGEILVKGNMATSILSSPEPLPTVSDDEMSKALNEAQGSVADFQGLLKDIEAQRFQIKDDLCASLNLMWSLGLSEFHGDLITTRVPGQTNSIFAPHVGIPLAEITLNKLVAVDMNTGVAPCPPTPSAHAAPTVDSRTVLLHAAILKARPSSTCVLQARPPHASSLALAANAGSGSQAAAALLLSSAGFTDAVACDATTSLAPEADPCVEGKRLAELLGTARVMLMGGRRGVLVAAESLAEGLDALIRLERAARDAALVAHYTALLSRPAPPKSSPPLAVEDPTAAAAAAAARFAGLKRALYRGGSDAPPRN